MRKEPIENVIFDLGGVLIDWNPKYLYHKIFRGDKKKLNWFLSTVCTGDWNVEQDAGRSLAEATRSLIDQYPEHEDHIRAYYDRWEEMFSGEITGTVAILEELKEKRRHGLYALTNWSAETFPMARRTFDFLQHFEGIVVSGEEKTRKPFADIYDILLSRYSLQPGSSVFIDDNLENVHAAENLGIRGVLFREPEQLRHDLEKLGIL